MQDPRESRELSDEQLLARVAAGDRPAMGVLVDRHQAAVHRYARSMTSDVGRAEDALQQGFLDAMKGAGSFSGRGSVRGWLFVLTRNALFRAARRRAGEPQAFVPLEQLACQAGWGEDPETQTSRTLDRERLRAALGRLSATSAEILVLRDLEGFTGPESADMLGISLLAAKSRLHRARLELAATLRQEVPHG